MNQPIDLTLTVGQAECLRGESVYFSVTLANVSKDVLKALPTFFAYNHSLRVIARGPKGELDADPLSPTERDGRHSHGPEEAKRKDLPPRESFALRDDLLTWFGELAPGTYELHAAYTGDFYAIESKPVVLRVRQAAPAALSVPQYGATTSDAPLTGAWANRQEQGFSLFYQQFSPNLPRNLWHGVRTAQTKQFTGLWAAGLARPVPSVGHLLWSDAGDHLMLSVAELDQPRESPPVRLKVPFGGRPLNSPVTLTPEAVAFVLADSKGERVAGIRADVTGNCQAAELDLGKAKPIGATACVWQFDERLHLLWAAKRGRELMYGRLQLGDVPAGFSTRTIHLANDPIVWVDAGLDLNATLQVTPYFNDPKKEESAAELHEPAEPALMVWCVTAAGGKIVATPLALGGGTRKTPVPFAHPDADKLRIVSSVVTRVEELVLLLADSQRRLYVASTGTRSLKPLSEIAATTITADQSPGLVTARENGLEAWVYLEYIEGQDAIKFLRIEPRDEPDPIERHVHSSGTQAIDSTPDR